MTKIERIPLNYDFNVTISINVNEHPAIKKHDQITAELWLGQYFFVAGGTASESWDLIEERMRYGIWSTLYGHLIGPINELAIDVITQPDMPQRAMENVDKLRQTICGEPKGLRK